MSDCTDVCDEICNRLSAAGFDLPGDEDLGPEGHDRVLEMLGDSVIIPARFLVKETAMFLDGPGTIDVRLEAEEAIADILEQQECGDVLDAYEVARVIFFVVAALLRPDMFEGTPLIGGEDGAELQEPMDAAATEEG